MIEMSDLAVQVENLSKRYQIGELVTMRDLPRVAWGAVKAPFRCFRKSDPSVVSGLGKEFWALRDVNVDVHRGEVLGIVGANGAGKSTLLKILSRITAPTTGHITMHGRSASLLEVGTGFHPELTGRENIYLNGSILGMNKREIDSKLDEIIEFSGVSEFIETPVKRYSSGMRVRLAFAVAAHLDPEILIVDEVLAVGDAAFQSKCLTRMSEVANEGRTVLFVSHNMGAVRSLCSRCVLLRSGGLVLDSTPDAILKEYLNLTTETCEAEFTDSTVRTGSGEARIESARVLQADGRVASAVVMGEPVVIEIEFSADSIVRHPVFAIGINSSLGQPIIRLSSREIVGEMPAVNSGGRVQIAVPSLPLLPGSYYVTIHIGNGQDRVDNIRNALKLSIAPGDVYPTGKYPDPSSGYFAYAPARFDINYT